MTYKEYRKAKGQSVIPKQLQRGNKTKSIVNCLPMGGQLQNAPGDISGKRQIQDIKDALLKGTDGLPVHALAGPGSSDKKANTGRCNRSGE
jgi:hypothetical protein